MSSRAIPQLVWAIIKASCHFYSTVYTKEDLVSKDGQLLSLPIAGLDAYTFLLKAKLPIKINGILEQWWTPNHKCPALANTMTAPKPPVCNDNSPKQQSSNPFHPASSVSSSQHIIKTNPNPLLMFATNETLCNLKTKQGQSHAKLSH